MKMGLLEDKRAQRDREIIGKNVSFEEFGKEWKLENRWKD